MQYWVAFGFVLLLSAATLAADDKLKHNAVTEKEAADGWLLLFDGESTFGWQSPNGSKWTIANGMLAPQAEMKGLLRTTTAIADYELKIDYLARLTDSENSHLLINCDREGKNYTQAILLRPYNKGWCTLSVTVRDGKPVGATATALTGMQNSFKVPIFPSEGEDKMKPKQAGFVGLIGNGLLVRNMKLKPLGTTSQLPAKP